MVAIIFIKGTNYACSHDLQWELNMPAISEPKRTVYACNVLSTGTRYTCNNGNRPKGT